MKISQKKFKKSPVRASKYTRPARAIKAEDEMDVDIDVQEEETGVDAELEAYVLAKIEERKAAKKEKNFALADAIRNELLEKGIVLEDTREGVKWKRA